MNNKAQVILEELVAMAFEQASAISGNDNDPFESGRLMAFYEILSVAKEQAQLMGITFDHKALNDLNPEELLK